VGLRERFMRVLENIDGDVAILDGLISALNKSELD
jgi:hypothetical protein